MRLDDGTWRLYVCCASPLWPASKQWWTEMLESDEPSGFPNAARHEVFRDDDVALKDTVIRRRDGRWFAWVCCHPLAERDEEDRIAEPVEDGILRPVGHAPVSVARYLDVVERHRTGSARSTSTRCQTAATSCARNRSSEPDWRVDALAGQLYDALACQLLTACGGATTSQARRRSSPTGTIDRFVEADSVGDALHAQGRSRPLSRTPITIGATPTMSRSTSLRGEQRRDHVGTALDEHRLGPGCPQDLERRRDRDRDRRARRRPRPGRPARGARRAGRDRIARW